MYQDQQRLSYLDVSKWKISFLLFREVILKSTTYFHIITASLTRPVHQQKPLQSGTKESRPSHVPNYLPSFPDPHSYVKTLVRWKKQT